MPQNSDHVYAHPLKPEIHLNSAGLKVLTVVTLKRTVFWDVILCSSVLPASCLAYSSIPKMEAECSFETSVNFYGITRRHCPDNTAFDLNNRRIQYLPHRKLTIPLSQRQILLQFLCLDIIHRPVFI
jgi:hypothetical protein